MPFFPFSVVSISPIVFNVLFAARGILDNFEISLAVLLPNTTGGHAITYTNPIKTAF